MNRVQKLNSEPAVLDAALNPKSNSKQGNNLQKQPEFSEAAIAAQAKLDQVIKSLPPIPSFDGIPFEHNENVIIIGKFMKQ